MRLNQPSIEAGSYFSTTIGFILGRSGEIGSQVAGLEAAKHIRVLGYSRSPRPLSGFAIQHKICASRTIRGLSI